MSWQASAVTSLASIDRGHTHRRADAGIHAELSSSRSHILSQTCNTQGTSSRKRNTAVFTRLSDCVPRLRR